MPITASGLIETEEMLVRLDTTAKKRVTAKLIEAAGKLQKLAIRMAPRDLANLEKAIKLRPEHASDERVRDALGRFQRVEIEVYIDMDMPAEGRRAGAVVGDYAWEIHEHMEPMGTTFRLGVESQEKQAADPSVTVGGGFLTRAADEIEQGLDALFLEALSGIL